MSGIWEIIFYLHSKPVFRKFILKLVTFDSENSLILRGFVAEMCCSNSPNNFFRHLDVIDCFTISIFFPIVRTVIYYAISEPEIPSCAVIFIVGLRSYKTIFIPKPTSWQKITLVFVKSAATTTAACAVPSV